MTVVRVPQQVSETNTNHRPVNIEHLHGLRLDEVEAEAARRARFDSSPGWMGGGR